MLINLVGETEKLMCVWEDNIRFDIKEIGYGDTDWVFSGSAQGQ
jgi:hypothetical protein